MLFRLNPSQDFGDTLSSEQWMHLTKLVELIDTKMEKQEAIRKCL